MERRGGGTSLVLRREVEPVTELMSDVAGMRVLVAVWLAAVFMIGMAGGQKLQRMRTSRAVLEATQAVELYVPPAQEPLPVTWRAGTWPRIPGYGHAYVNAVDVDSLVGMGNSTREDDICDT